MLDEKFEGRKNKFQKNSLDIMESREKFKLSLRKEKIEEHFFNKRNIKVNPHKDYEIDPSKLNVSDDKIQFQAKNFEEEIAFINELLYSKELDEVQFGIYKARAFVVRNAIESSDYFWKKLLTQLLEIFKGSTDRKIRYEIIWIFLQLAVGDVSNFYKYFCDNVILDVFDNLLNSDSQEIKAILLTFLSNLIGDQNIDVKISVLGSKLYDTVKKLIIEGKNSLEVSQNLAYFISNIVSQTNPCLDEKILLECQSLMFKLIEIQDLDIACDCLWGFFNLTNNDYLSLARNIYDRGIVQKLLEINYKDYSRFKIPALRIFGNLISMDATTTEEMVKLGVLNKLEVFLNESNKQILRETLWAISNLAGGTKGQIEKILQNQNVLNRVISLTKDTDFSVKMEAINVLSFATTGSDLEMIIQMVNFGILDIFTELLTTNTEPRLIMCLLEAIDYILSQGEILKQISRLNPFANRFENLGGVQHLNRLQSHKNQTVYQTSTRLLEIYFSYLIVNS